MQEDGSENLSATQTHLFYTLTYIDKKKTAKRPQTRGTNKKTAKRSRAVSTSKGATKRPKAIGTRNTFSSSEHPPVGGSQYVED